MAFVIIRHVDVGVVPIFTRDKNGRQSVGQHEIDFVVNRGNDKLYIQSALRLDDETKERQETASLSVSVSCRFCLMKQL